MRESFEVRRQDGAGRLGELTVPRAGVTVDTPALMPVVHPDRQTVEPARFDEFGADVLITNSYIIKGSDDLRERAREEGLHGMLGFDGAIVTDSGSFQLSEYGEIDVTNEEILRFQHEIGSDVGTPVDIPTPPDAGRERAESDLETTLERVEAAAALREDLGEMLVNAPVQGATFPDLRERAGRAVAETGLDVYPVGAAVPMLNSYRYAELVDSTMAAKRGLPADAPVHLFGAGHPMTFALAAAMGCDLFDSAAYALYARDGRYLTVRGTEPLADLRYFPCSCAVCSSHTPAELRGLPDGEREAALAKHNLHVSFAEIRRVKQAIRDGDLFELVEARARSHPALLDGYRTLLDYAEQLEESDPAQKSTFFHLSGESARRPEVLRHHERLDRLDPTGRVLLAEGGAEVYGAGAFDAEWRVDPPFGPVPPALVHTYPVGAETPGRMDDAGYEAAAEGVSRLVGANPETEFVLAHRGWPRSARSALPDIGTIDLSTDSSAAGAEGGQ
jgi:7-cyano-7-deazaguanine tRNA-ribosyltransferase